MSLGETVLIENLGESVDAVLDPIVGRNTIKKGRAIKLGDKEVEYNPAFKLILHTKLANPHYQPELQVIIALICVQTHIHRLTLCSLLHQLHCIQNIIS